MKLTGFQRVLGLLLLGLAAGCAKQPFSVAEPRIEGQLLLLDASTPDMARQPLFDRVDLLLLPPGKTLEASDYGSSTAYYDAIRTAGAFYLGGDYLDDAERDSGRARYELQLPGGQLPAGLAAGLACVTLSGDSVHIVQQLPVSGWPPAE